MHGFISVSGMSCRVVSGTALLSVLQEDTAEYGARDDADPKGVQRAVDELLEKARILFGGSIYILLIYLLVFRKSRIFCYFSG